MTFMERLRFLLGLKESQARIVMNYNKVGQAINTPANYESFANKGFSKNVVVYSAIHKITTACMGIEWEAYSKNSQGEKTEISDSPLLTLWNKPNPMQSRAAFIESLVGFRMIAGNSYIEANKPFENKPPIELWPDRPDKMKIVAGANGYPAAYQFSYGGVTRNWPVNPQTLQSLIMHWKSFNPLDDWYGLSPLQAAMLSLDQSNAGQQWNLALLQNSATPSGVLQMKVSDGNPRGALTQEQFDRLKKEFEENYQGAKNTGRPMIIEGGLQWQGVSLSPREMDFLKGKEVTAIDLCNAFGVPPEMMGLGQKTFNNYKEARLSFYEETVLPLMDSLRDQVNNWLAPAFGENIYLDYDRDDIEALVYRREQKYTSLATVNYLSQNEKRAAVGYEEIPGQDFFVIGSQLVGLDGEIISGGANAQAQPGNPQQDQNADPQADAGSVNTDKNPSQTDEEQTTEEPGSKEKVEWKSINLISATEKRESWQRQNRRRKKLTAPFNSELLAEYKKLIKHLSGIAKRLEGSDIKVIEFALMKEINSHKDEFAKVIGKNIKITLDVFSQMLLRDAKSQGLTLETKANAKFDNFVQHYIEQHTAESIKSINTTNEKKMRLIIKEWVAEGITAGDTLPELSDFIEAEFDDVTKSQAMRIARTEISVASNNGALEAAKSLEIPGLWKEWVTANDDRVRDGGPKNDLPDHGAMNGASVPVDDKFGVPPDTLMDGPGDDSAPAGQVINCRCVLTFRKRSED